MWAETSIRQQIEQWDTDWFVTLNTLGSSAWDGFWIFMSEKLYQIPLYIVLLYILFTLYSKKQIGVILLLTALLITCTDQTSNIFKNVLFLRPRPCPLEYLQEVGRIIAERCGRHGFFSAHAASSMAIAIFVGHLLQSKSRLWMYGLIIWSLVVSYSRIYLGVHYPLDILTGWFFGVLFGLGFFLIFQRISHTYLEKLI